jgi:hypothetical protein
MRRILVSIASLVGLAACSSSADPGISCRLDLPDGGCVVERLPCGGDEPMQAKQAACATPAYWIPDASTCIPWDTKSAPLVATGCE